MADLQKLTIMSKDQRFMAYMMAMSRLCHNNGGILEVDIEDGLKGQLFAIVYTKDGRRKARFEFTSKDKS